MTREFGRDGVHAVNDAGEYLGELVPKGAQRSKKTFGEPFVVLFQQAAAALAARKDLTASDYRVFLALLARASQENPVFDTDPAGLSLELGMHLGQVSRSVRRLGETGLIERPFRGKVALNPAIAWRGTSEQRAKWRKERELA